MIAITELPEPTVIAVVRGNACTQHSSRYGAMKLRDFDSRALRTELSGAPAGLTSEIFEKQLPELLTRRHFPLPDLTTGNFDLKAIDA
jgi:hypothetical protein